MADFFWLTPSDRQLLDELAQERRSKVTVPRYESPEVPLPQTPDLYVARTPEGGIPALTRVAGNPPRDLPGEAVCDIFELIQDYPDQRAYLEPHPGNELFARPVRNINLDAIGGNRWILAVRSKGGAWYALSPWPFPSDDDTIYTGTGSGTSGGVPDDEDDVPFPPPDCQAVYVEEVDLFCQSWSQTIAVAGTGLGTGTGTSQPPGTEFDYFLNLYRRRVWLRLDPLTGCLIKSADSWVFVRTVSCCDPECSTPDTGTSPVSTSESCCEGLEPADTVTFTLSGLLLPGCNISNTEGSLTRYSDDVLLWTNGGGTTSNDGQVTTVLRLYCTGDEWRMSGTIFRTGVVVNIDFDVATELSGNGLSLNNATGSILIGGSCGSVSISVDHPCPEPDEPGTIEVDCCENLIPETLTVTVTGRTGDCTCLPDTFEITWNGFGWKTESAGGSCGGSDIDFDLSCFVGGTGPTDFRLGSTSEGVNEAPTGTPTCDPFNMVFELTLTNSCTGTATFTITE